MRLIIILISLLCSPLAILAITDTPEAHKPKAQIPKEHRAHGMLQHVCERGNYKHCDKIAIY